MTRIAAAWAIRELVDYNQRYLTADEDSVAGNQAGRALHKDPGQQPSDNCIPITFARSRAKRATAANPRAPASTPAAVKTACCYQGEGRRIHPHEIDADGCPG